MPPTQLTFIDGPLENLFSQLGWDTAGALIISIFRDRTADEALSLGDFVHVQGISGIAYPTTQAAHAFGDLRASSAAGQSRNIPFGGYQLETVDANVGIVWLSTYGRVHVQMAFNFTRIVEAVSPLG